MRSQCCARTFAPSRELCAELHALGFVNLGLMSRGVDTALFHPNRRSLMLRAAWGAADDAPMVLHVGRMAAEKNYPLLFRCYAAMRAANPRSLRLVVPAPVAAADSPARGSLAFSPP